MVEEKHVYFRYTSAASMKQRHLLVQPLTHACALTHILVVYIFKSHN